MKIKNITIHNLRSVPDGQFNLDNYTLLVGENNAYFDMKLSLI